MPGSVALRAVGRAPGDCVQIAPTDAEIVQFPVAQLAQFRQCEPVDAPLLHCGDNGVENTGDAVERTCFDCMGFGCDSHSLTHFQRFPGSGLMPVSDAPKIGICCTCTIPELVNAAMQKTHMSAGRGEDRASGTSAGKRPVHNGVSAANLSRPAERRAAPACPPAGAINASTFCSIWTLWKENRQFGLSGKAPAQAGGCPAWLLCRGLDNLVRPPGWCAIRHHTEVFPGPDYRPRPRPRLRNPRRRISQSPPRAR